MYNVFMGNAPSQDISSSLTSLEKHERRAHVSDGTNQSLFEETIQLALPSVEALYNPYDPAPLAERSLHPEVESYLCSRLEAGARYAHVHIAMHLPAVACTANTQAVLQQSVNSHFKNAAVNQLLQNSRTTRIWLFRVLFAVVFLGLCLVLAHVCRQRSETTPFFGVLGEGFGIIGWVAIWEPALFFLYGWQQNMRTLRSYMRLHHATVSVVADN